jgi:tetratricopeptide (TPR) repeat protein
MNNVPNNYKGMRKLVVALQKQKKYSNALAVVNKMHKLFGDKNLHDIILLKLQTLRMQRKYTEITTAFPEEELEQLKGAHGISCRIMVGFAYESLGKYTKAVAEYEKASKLLKNGPHVGIVRMMKAECENNKLKDFAAALKSYKKAVDTVGYFESAKTKALYEIAKIQFEANNNEKALAAINQIMQQKKPGMKWKNKALKLKEQYSN